MVKKFALEKYDGTTLALGSGDRVGIVPAHKSFWVKWELGLITDVTDDGVTVLTDSGEVLNFNSQLRIPENGNHRFFSEIVSLQDAEDHNKVAKLG